MTDTVYSDVNKTAEYFGVSIHTIRKWVKEANRKKKYVSTVREANVHGLKSRRATVDFFPGLPVFCGFG